MSRRTFDPRWLLRKLIEQDPTASEKAVRDKFVASVKNDQKYLLPVLHEWFASNIRNFSLEKRGPHEFVIRDTSRDASRKRRKDQRRRVEVFKAQITAALMDHLLSNGKKLRDATFGECRREGGWLLSVGKLGAANEIVGRKLTEADVRNLFDRAALDRRGAAVAIC